MTDAQTVAGAMATLRSMFPGVQIPEPSQALISRWGQDPFTYGSYSFAKAGCKGSVYRDMAAPVGKRCVGS